jgi:competence protein ComEA
MITRFAGPEDAQGLAMLLVAVLLAAGTTLSQFGAEGPPFAPPADPQNIGRSVPQAAPVEVRTRGGQEAGKPGLSNPLDLNSADAEALQALPGIGPALAERIVADREAHGSFRTPEDLLRVSGIGPKRWERIRPLVRLTEEP